MSTNNNRLDKEVRPQWKSPKDEESKFSKLSGAKIQGMISNLLVDISGLSLEDKGITQITDLEGFSNLRRMDLSNNELVRLNGFISTPKLSMLNVSENKFNDDSALEDLRYLLELRTLNISGHPNLKSIRTHIVKSLNKLQALICSNCGFERLSFIQFIPNLNTLVASHNLLDSFSLHSLGPFPFLSKLSLGHNQITSFPDISSVGSSLKELRLSHNSLSSLPEGTFLSTTFPQLKILDLSHNHLSDWTHVSSLTSLKSLTNLVLQGNPLPTPSVEEMESIQLREDLADEKGLVHNENDKLYRRKVLHLFQRTVGMQSKLFIQLVILDNKRVKVKWSQTEKALIPEVYFEKGGMEKEAYPTHGVLTHQLKKEMKANKYKALLSPKDKSSSSSSSSTSTTPPEEEEGRKESEEGNEEEEGKEEGDRSTEFRKKNKGMGNTYKNNKNNNNSNNNNNNKNNNKNNLERSGKGEREERRDGGKRKEKGNGSNGPNKSTPSSSSSSSSFSSSSKKYQPQKQHQQNDQQQQQEEQHSKSNPNDKNNKNNKRSRENDQERNMKNKSNSYEREGKKERKEAKAEGGGGGDGAERSSSRPEKKHTKQPRLDTTLSSSSSSPTFEKKQQIHHHHPSSPSSPSSPSHPDQIKSQPHQVSGQQKQKQQKDQQQLKKTPQLQSRSPSNSSSSADLSSSSSSSSSSSTSSSTNEKQKNNKKNKKSSPTSSTSSSSSSPLVSAPFQTLFSQRDQILGGLGKGGESAW